MNECGFTDETATVLVLSQIVKDVRHLLDWLSAGMACIAIVNAIRAIGDAGDREWIGFSLDLLCVVWFTALSSTTAKRGRRYDEQTDRG